MELPFSKQYKNFKRAEEIISVFASHGFEEAIASAQEKGPLRELALRFFPPKQKTPVGIRLRRAFEDLGPTFVKFGQLLSTRSDLLPEPVVKELEKLVDEVKPLSFETVKEILRDEYGDYSKIFKNIEEKPLAAASIAQVHRATLANGRKIVLKVQRPNIENKIEADIQILLDLAVFFENNFPESKFYSPAAVVQDFAKTIRRELDFLHEMRNAIKFRTNFEGDEEVFVPEVYPEYCTRRVLVQEYVDGVRLLQIHDYPASRRKKIVEAGARSLIKQVLVHGFFQADPHHGNIIAMKGDRIGIVDFGMMGFLDEKTRETTTDFFVSLIKKDTDKLVDYFLSVGVLPKDADVPAFKEDLAEVIDQYYNVPISQMHLDEVVRDLTGIIRDYKVRMHPKSMLLMRMLVTLEGIGRKLYPQFNTIEVAKPVVERLISERKKPLTVLKKSWSSLEEIAEAASKIPIQFSGVLSKAEEGNLNLNIQHYGLHEPISELDRTINKVSLSLIVAALILASSILIATNIKPMLWGYSALGLAGLAIALLFGLVLVGRIFTSREF
ncbi:MAG: AarF/ABC1/UbiB kinase family protein [Candidatus Micrarchaeota archaeon]